MAYIQDVTPPPNKIMNFSLKNFSGGMNNRSDQIADNEGAVLKNLKFADDTVLETRYGQKYYDDKKVDGAVVFIDEFKPYRDEPIFIRATENKIYFNDFEFPVEGVVSGVSHFGHYYFVDGKGLKVYANFEHDYEDKNPITDKKFQEDVIDESQFEGLTIKEAAEKAVANAERGKRNHEVEYAKNLVNKLDEEDGYSSLLARLNAITINVEDKILSPTYFKTIGTKLTGYNVYDVVSPKEQHKRLGKEHLQGVTTVDYNKKEIYYEPCENEVLDHLKGMNVVPESLRYIVSHQDRIFASGDKTDDDNIFISDKINPLYFPVGLPMQVPPTSDKVRGLHIFDGACIIGREHDMYVILGETNNPKINLEPFSLKKLNTHTGFASNRAVDIAHNYLIFLGSDGIVYGIQNARANERDLSTVVLSRTIDLSKYPIEVDKKDYTSASSAFFNNEWHLSVGDKVMVYSYRHMAWTMYDGLNARCWYGIDGEWIWGNTNGRVSTFDKESFFDFGEPYQSLWYSGIFDMKEAAKFKQFREFFLVAHTFENQYSDIYVTFEVDYAEVKDRAVISNQLSIWGKSLWGDRFVKNNINESLPFVIGRRGRNIRFKVSNGYYKDGEIPTRIDEKENVDNLLNYPNKRDGMLVDILDENKTYLYMDKEWIPMEEEELNQRMKIYQINGDYEMRGNR